MQFFQIASFVWTASIAVSLYLLLVKNWQSKHPLTCCAAVVIVALVDVLVVVVGWFNDERSGRCILLSRHLCIDTTLMSFPFY